MATQNGEQLGEACGVLDPKQPDRPESSELSVPTSEVVESSHRLGGKACDKDQRLGGSQERVPGTDLSEVCELRRGPLCFCGGELGTLCSLRAHTLEHLHEKKTEAVEGVSMGKRNGAPQKGPFYLCSSQGRL